jgi:hypothetical protein
MDLSEAVLAPSWQALPHKAQQILSNMLNKLVEILLLKDAVSFEDTITGTEDFNTWFGAQGPHDQHGRSLRELDLKQQLFKYPLSYLIYSSGFDSLPPYAKDYVYQKLAAVLEGRDQSESFAYLSASERKTILEILTATKADLVPYIDSDASTLTTSALSYPQD